MATTLRRTVRKVTESEKRASESLLEESINWTDMTPAERRRRRFAFQVSRDERTETVVVHFSPIQLAGIKRLAQGQGMDVDALIEAAIYVFAREANTMGHCLTLALGSAKFWEAWPTLVSPQKRRYLPKNPFAMERYVTELQKR